MGGKGVYFSYDFRIAFDNNKLAMREIYMVERSADCFKLLPLFIMRRTVAHSFTKGHCKVPL
jgi:hypothetical protein